MAVLTFGDGLTKCRQASDNLTVDVELGFHGFKDDPPYRRNLITFEAVVRLKVGL